MTIRRVLWCAAVALTLGAMSAPQAIAQQDDAAQETGKPNILFIMADDHCSQAVGAYGSRLAELNPTPTIDTLARDGMLFSNCFVTNSICTPSRACIMTGQYSHVNGVRTLGRPLGTEKQYLAHEMNAAGYHTAMVGKWHLREEPGAFDYYKVFPGQGLYHDPIFRIRGELPWRENTVQYNGMHSSDAVGNIALEWFEEGWNQEDPFFMMLHFKAPHDMFEHAERYNDYLADTMIPEPENLWNQPNFGSIGTRGYNDELRRHIGTSVSPRHGRNFSRNWGGREGTTEEITRNAYNEYLRRYLRCVKGVDDNVARVFEYLDAHGLTENTLVIYTGDQGFMLGEHDFIDKRWMYEESLRMPLLVRLPGSIEAGSRSDAIIENIDFPAMMLDFAGHEETPEYMQGVSFRSICETGVEPEEWRDGAYYRYWQHMAHHFNPSHLGIRTKRYKLIFFFGCSPDGGFQTPPSWELYDLQEDPHEVNNVYDDPAYAEIMLELKEQLAELKEQNGDTDERHPNMRAHIEEYWDYDEEDRQRAIGISNQFRESRERGRQRN